MSAQPPRLLRRLMTWLLPSGRVRDGLLGDLDELYAERVRQGSGTADRWYARQLLSAAAHYPIRRLWARLAHGEATTMIGRLARDFRRDVRYAFRGLGRSPGFTITVVLTLGLGIGANTAMFGIMDRLMVRPFPYLRDPDAVHRVYLQRYDRGTLRTTGSNQYTRFLDLERFSTRISQAAGFANFTLAVGTGDAARERGVGLVSASFFDFFDAQPALGRWFDASEDRTPRGAEVVVIGWEMWQTEYGGRDVTGEPLQVHNIPCTIIGVAPRGFVGVWDGSPPDVYVPITTYAGSNPNEQDRTTYYTRYNWGWMNMMVRREPGVSQEEASADLSRAYRESWAVEAEQRTIAPVNVAKPRAVAGPLKTAAGPDPTVEAKTVKWVSGIALIVLLIACSNVANLFLARAVRRRRETAVRLALGVGRRRLVTQWFTESLLLALIGAVAAVVIAQWGGAALRGLFVDATGAPIPVLTDWRTLGLSAGLAIVAAVLSGVAPAIVAGRIAVADVLKSGAREGTYQHSSVRTGLLVLQITMSVILLVGAGLFVRSFAHVRAMPLGYDPEPAVFATPNLRGAAMPDSQRIDLHRRILERARAIPGVQHAAMASSIPFWSTSSTTLIVPGIDSVAPLGDFTYQVATPDYFNAMGTRIVAGRPFTDADRAGTSPVAVVSAAMANVLWPGDNPIGKRMRVGSDTAAYTTIVGVAEDAVQNQLQGDDRFRYYLPADQFRPDRARYLIARVSGDPATMGETIRKTLQPLMPGQAYITSTPMRDIISGQQRAWRFGATMFVAFGGLALVVAAIGLYGSIGYGVAQRMHELGVRAALGAQRWHLLRLVLAQALRVVAAGLVAGTAIAWALGAQIQPLLFEQRARDPLIFAAVSLMLAIVAIAAGVGPARRAARADPNTALRTE